MRRPAPGGVRNRPPIRAKACTNLPFRLCLEVVHQFEEDLGARALADGVPRAQDPRRPLVVALEYRGGNKRDQRVCERVLVLEIPDPGEALTHQRDRLVGVSTHAQPSIAENVFDAADRPWATTVSISSA